LKIFQVAERTADPPGSAKLVCYHPRGAANTRVSESPSLVLSTDAAVAALDLVAHYDRLRLTIYKARGSRGHRIAIEEYGSSTFLRFDDVGYFNAVYDRLGNLHQHFDRVDEFFDGSTFACRVVSPALHAEGGLARECHRRGWVAGDSYAWLSTTALVPPDTDRHLVVRSVRGDEAEMFFRIYLTAFDAAAHRIPAALDNMRHLFEERSLHFQFAMVGADPAGVGIVLRIGDAALLSAGAMLPRYRGLGGHEALIAARLQLAHRLGCTSVHSWAAVGGRSHRALERMGLRTVATSHVWHRHPRP